MDERGGGKTYCVGRGLEESHSMKHSTVLRGLRCYRKLPRLLPTTLFHLLAYSNNSFSCMKMTRLFISQRMIEKLRVIVE